MAGMDLAHCRTLSNEFLNNNPYAVPEQASLIILVKKSDIYMANNDKEKKQTYFQKNSLCKKW